MAKKIKEFRTRSKSGKEKYVIFAVENNKFQIVHGQEGREVNRVDIFDKKDMTKILSSLIKSYKEMLKYGGKQEVSELIKNAVLDQDSDVLKKMLIKDLIFPDGIDEVITRDQLNEITMNLRELKGEIYGMALDETILDKYVTSKKGET